MTTPLDTSWLDRRAYPFTSHFFELSMGRMHYIDEGGGRPIVFVHGTPTWSFLYRHLIAGLASEYRVIAPDNIGFGLSDKPPGWSYRIPEQAANLRQLIEHLDLDNMTLVVHDFGGPIGLSYALAQPERVRSLVIMNTFLWSVADMPDISLVSRIMGGPFGRWLNRRTNFDPQVTIPAVMVDKRMFTREVRRHYSGPFPRPQDRNGPMWYAGEFVASDGWFAELWEQRDRIAGKPMQILWGMRDPLFTPKRFLTRWKTAFPAAQVIELPETGHMVPEEQREALVPLVRDFL